VVTGEPSPQSIVNPFQVFGVLRLKEKLPPLQEYHVGFEVA
jgi:hypothetical protein